MRKLLLFFFALLTSVSGAWADSYYFATGPTQVTSITSGNYYVINGIDQYTSNKHYLFDNGTKVTSNNPQDLPTDYTASKFIWKIEGNSTDGYTLKNLQTGNYMSLGSQNGSAISTGSTPQTNGIYFNASNYATILNSNNQAIDVGAYGSNPTTWSGTTTADGSRRLVIYEVNVVEIEDDACYTIAFNAKTSGNTWGLRSGTTEASPYANNTGDVYVAHSYTNSDGNKRWIFVNNSNGTYLAYHGQANTDFDTSNAINEWSIASLTAGSGNVSADANCAGKVCITNDKRYTNNTDKGCYIVKEENGAYDASSAPYYNGSFTSALTFTATGDDVSSAATSVIEKFDNMAYVTYKVKMESSGDVKETSAATRQEIGGDLSLPSASARGFCTYTYYSDESCTTPITAVPDAESATVYALCSFNPPFTVSENYNSATWYFLKLKGSRYPTYGSATTPNVSLPSTLSTTDTNVMWAFMGNPYNGIQIINKGAGSSLVLGSGADNQGSEGGASHATMAASGTQTYERWFPKSSTYQTNGFYLYNSNNHALNYRNNGSLDYWTGGADNGSTFTVEEVYATLNSWNITSAVPTNYWTSMGGSTPAGVTEMDQTGLQGGLDAYSRSQSITTTQDGGYKIYFNFTSGDHRLQILGVDVLDGSGTVVSSDYHFGYTGGNHSNRNYFVNIPAGTYTLRYIINGKNDTDQALSSSQGNITLTSYPFEFSSDYSSAKWYCMRIGSNNWIYAGTTSNGVTPTAISNQVSSGDAYLWAFIGSANDGGFKMMNKKAGDGNYAHSNAVGAASSFTIQSGEEVYAMEKSGSTIYFKNKKGSGSGYYMEFLDGRVIGFTYDSDPQSGVTSLSFRSYYDVLYSELISELKAINWGLATNKGKVNYYNFTGNTYGGFAGNEMSAIETLEGAGYSSSNLATAQDILANGYALNMPATGKFYRIKGKTSGKYLASGLATNSKFNMTDATDATTIFYFDGTKLTNLSSGMCNGMTKNAWAWVVGTNASTVLFQDGLTNGGYGVKSATCNFYDNGDGTNSADRGDNLTLSSSTNARYTSWYLTEITSLPVTISSVGYATFCSPVAVTIPTGVTAYIASDEGTYLHLTEIEGGIIPANEGVILTGEAGPYNFNITTGGSVGDNVLTGTVVAIERPTDSYILSKNSSDVVAFYKDGANTIPGFKAYLASGVGDVKEFRFDDADGIGAIVDALQSESRVIYNLAGQRVSKMQKGVNIVNGKKVIVK